MTFYVKQCKEKRAPLLSDQRERKKDANSTELQLQAKITQLTAGVLGLGQHVLTIIIMHVVPDRIMALHFQLDFDAQCKQLMRV